MFRNLFSRNQEKSNTNKECKQYLEYKVIKEFENNECIICLDSMKINDTVIVLGCGHSYHKECLIEWFKKKKICPLCDI